MDWERTGNNYCAELKIDGKSVAYFLIYDKIHTIELYIQLPPAKGFLKQSRTFSTVADAKNYVENSYFEEVL